MPKSRGRKNRSKAMMPPRQTSSRWGARCTRARRGDAYHPDRRCPRRQLAPKHSDRRQREAIESFARRAGFETLAEFLRPGR